MGEDMEEELEDDGQSELARMQKARLGDSDLAQYAIKGDDKVRLTQCAHDVAHVCHTPISPLLLIFCSFWASSLGLWCRIGKRPLVAER